MSVKTRQTKVRTAMFRLKVLCSALLSGTTYRFVCLCKFRDRETHRRDHKKEVR